MFPRQSCGRRGAELGSWNGIPPTEVVNLVDDDLVDVSIQEIEADYNDDELKELNILNYLMGKPLSEEEESDVLQSLQNTNAACIDDLLQIINEDNSQGSPPKETERNSTDTDVISRSPTLDVVSCMRLRICSLELSAEGLSLCQSLKQGTSNLIFIIVYQPPRSTVQNFSIRLCSKRICNNVVSFEHEKLHSCESSKPLDFTIYLKKCGSQETVFGEATFDWTKFLSTGSSRSEVNLIVKNHSKNIVYGKLKIRVQVGDEREVAAKPHNFQHEKPASHLEKKQASPEPVVVQLTDDVKELQKKSPSSSISPNKPVLLRNLFLATSARNFKEAKNANLFLVLKAFWLDDDVKSSLKTSCNGLANFDFHLSAPVLLSPYFLNRCKGNNAILEVWHASTRGNELIGITLLPLHTFYLAYHDNLVTKALLDCKLPVVSVDHWLQVVSPRSGEQVGEIKCMLSFVSDDQVTHMEQKHGLRSADSIPNLKQSLPVQLPDEKVSHHFNISIIKISGLFGTKVEAECFVDCSIPCISDSGVAVKSLLTPLATCAIESKFGTKLTHSLELSGEKSFSKFLSNQAKDFIPFKIYCKFNMPKDKSIKVAEATLPLSEIHFLEDQFSISNEPAFLSLALPLKIEEGEVSRLITNSKGTLVVRLEYFKGTHDEVKKESLCTQSTSTQTEVQLSDFTEQPESDNSESIQTDHLWSTTLLSQLQRLRVSKTSSSTKAEETPKKTFRCLVQVEKAMQLPYLKTSTTTSITHSEPCTYVTISNEGDVNMSAAVLYSVEPMWNWTCHVDLPTHLLLEGGENLVLKVWQLPNCGEKPCTKTNSILCFAAVQIADLKYGLPKISGWFNLVNYSGKYSGKIYISITPMENLSELMFPKRNIPKQVPSPPSEPVEIKQNPFIDLSTSAMESTLRKQLTDLDELSSMLKHNATLASSDSTTPLTSRIRKEHNADPNSEEADDKKESSSEGSEEESSTDSVNSEVARLLAKCDLETLHKIVEQIDDEVMKINHCSKPDYVCSKTAEAKGEQSKDEGDKGEGSKALVPLVEVDEAASVGSLSDSGISSSTRKRHLHQ